MSSLVFVYGTLRKKAVANDLMADSLWKGEAFVPGRLYRIDWYPGVVYEPHSNQNWVIGDLFEVSTQVLKKLDEYEGCNEGCTLPYEYERIDARAKISNSTKTELKETWVACQLWNYQRNVGPDQQILSGDWLKPE